MWNQANRFTGWTDVKPVAVLPFWTKQIMGGVLLVVELDDDLHRLRHYYLE